MGPRTLLVAVLWCVLHLEASVQAQSCDMIRCMSGYTCVDGACVEDDTLCEKPPPSCEGVQCEPGEACQLEECDCSEPPCPEMPTCVPIDKCSVIFCEEGTYCYEGECYPLPTCEGFECEPGEVCHLEAVECDGPPCPPMPTCTTNDTCALVLCEEGTYCYEGECYPSPTCDGIECDPGMECILQDVECCASPCPPVPVCSPVDKCALILCQEGFVCEDGECVKEPNCDGVVCGPGEECFMRDGDPPFPSCRPETCATTGCPPGTNCVDSECVAPPSCDDITCPDYEECYIEVYPCLIPPCPEMPACRPILDCSTINCIAGTICVDNECIPDPCQDYTCPSGEECYLEEPKCSDPSSPPTPACRPMPDPCDLVRCCSGTICIDGQCIPEPTCDMYECPYGEECYIDESACDYALSTCVPEPSCRPKPTCEGFECPPGQECYLEQLFCIPEGPPCPTVPACKNITCCSSASCIPGEVCIDGYCVPEPTCEGYECPPGEECYLEEVVCIQAPCPAIPSCKNTTCCSTDSCIPGEVCEDGFCVPETLPQRDLCDGVECAEGEECHVVVLQCLIGPCPYIAVCRPKPTCETVHCPPGYLCHQGKCYLGPSCCD